MPNPTPDPVVRWSYDIHSDDWVPLREASTITVEDMAAAIPDLGPATEAIRRLRENLVDSLQGSQGGSGRHSYVSYDMPVMPPRPDPANTLDLGDVPIGLPGRLLALSELVDEGPDAIDLRRAAELLGGT